LFDIHVPEIRFALEAVRRAALLVRRIQTELVVSAQQKADRSPVTVADYASQALVAHLLAESFPGMPWLLKRMPPLCREPPCWNR